jgi:uncharacterized integral membrane protein
LLRPTFASVRDRVFSPEVNFSFFSFLPPLLVRLLLAFGTGFLIASLL